MRAIHTHSRAAHRIIAAFYDKCNKRCNTIGDIGGDALTLRVCLPTAENVVLPAVKPVLDAVAVIVQVS